MAKKKVELKIVSPFLDVQEMATYLKVQKSTIYAWIHQQRIPVRYHGRKPVGLIADLKKWSDEQNQVAMV